MGIISAIAGIGSAIIGANSARKQAKSQESANEKAIEASLMGFNYLKNNPIVGQTQQQGLAAGMTLGQQIGLGGGPSPYTNAIQDARLDASGISNLAAQSYSDTQNALGLYGALLGLGGDSGAVQQAFDNYRDSTGYQFRLNEGMGAITGGAATRGLLNSGATLRALQGYGQNLASQEFGNYLGHVTDYSSRVSGAIQNNFTNNLSAFDADRVAKQTNLGNYTDYLSALQSQQQTGLNAAFNVASQGTSAGATAAGIGQRGAAAVNDIRQQGTNNIVSGLGAAAGGLSDWWANRKVA